MTFNLNSYFISDKLKIFYSEEFISNSEFLKNLDKNSFIFFQFTWNIESCIDRFPWDYEIKINKVNKNFNVKTNIIFCAPNQNTLSVMINKGYNAILLNHNCLLDYNLYKLENNKERIYNAVINSRPFWWKRVYLANKINKLLYIKGNDWAQNKTSWYGYKNMDLTLKSEITQQEVQELYNKSKVGLILSGCTGENQQGLNEGANYSSSEYLLCGLPVISTKSQGGREYWFDEYNSIICEPNEDSIKKSVDIMLEKLSNGKIDRNKIRNKQIEKMNLMRENFINKTKEIFNKYSIDINAKQYFKDNYFNKMCIYKKQTFKDNNFNQMCNKKLLVIFRGAEGSSYLVNRLSKINILHDLGYEIFDKYNYKGTEKFIFSTFENDFFKAYKLNYNGKIPFCKCRIYNYFNLNNYDKFYKLIKKCNITHIIHLSRFEFESIIRLNYLQEMKINKLSFGFEKDAIGQFNENRNDLIKNLKGSLIVDNKKFEQAIENKQYYVNTILKERRLISEWKDVKLLNIDYTELVNLNDDKFYSIIKNFMNINNQNLNIKENVSFKVHKKTFSWFDLFDTKSQQYLKSKEDEWIQFINKINI